MKKAICLFLSLLTALSVFAAFPSGAFAESQITIAPYGSGMENYAESTQLLICPKIAGNWTDDWGAQLETYSWEITLTNAQDGASATVRLKPSSIYPGDSWGIVRFEPCAATGENRFVPEKNVPYTLSVKVYNGAELLYTADGGEQTWLLGEDPIVPEDPADEPEVQASGDGWAIAGGVLTVTSQNVMGNASSSSESYPWHEYRSVIREVVIGRGITSVGKVAFESCPALEKITFGEDTATFYGDCIARNSALKTVIFRCPAVSIGQGIVYLTNNITSVVLTDQTFEEFKEIAVKSAYNFQSYGGIATGFDKASYTVVKSYEYSVSNGVMTVSGVDAAVGSDGSLAEEYKWYGLTDGVTKVVLSEGIVSVGAHAFDGIPGLEEVRVSKSVLSLGDYAFANDPALKRICFEGLPETLGAYLAPQSALTSVVIADMTASDLRARLSQQAGNISSDGESGSPFDGALLFTVYVDGVWSRFGNLSSFGENEKLKDVNKDGVLNIADVSAILDYLSVDVKWAGSFYNVNKVGGTTINDVSALLDDLTSSCPHRFVFEEEVKGSCTEDGYDSRYRCTVCGNVITDSKYYPAPGHKSVADKAVAATCGANGLSAGSHCSVCGEILVEQTVIPATGQHVFRSVDGLSPTCGKDGYTAGQVCEVCSFAQSGHEIIPATGNHTPVADGEYPATCLRSGLTAGSHCSVCGNVLEAQTVIPAAGHVYENDRCVYCGKADFALISGKTALFTGDSLCAASTYDTEHRWWGWAGRIKETYGLSSYDKTGADGASVSNCRNTNTIINQINGKKTRTYDYVILEGGTNDGWDKAPVGSMTTGAAAQADPSLFDLTTFAGGLENLFYYAKQYFGNAKIGYVFTHKMNSNTGSLRDMSKYLAMAKQICEKWDIPMLNIDESPDFALKYYAGISELVPDGIHPSSAGYDMIYPSIARFMAEITLDDSFAIYEASIENLTDGPSPYEPKPDRDEDPQGWIRWLIKDYGETVTMFESGRPYTISYSADGGSHVASPFEFWGGHYQFDYIFNADEIDLRDNIGKDSYGYVWEIWYKDADAEEDYRVITTAPWSVYAPSCIYRIDTYDEGMNNLYLPEGEKQNKYDMVIVIRDRSGALVGWHKDSFNYTDSSELFKQQALDAGAIG